MAAFNDFAGTEPGKKILQLYSDNAKELCAAAKMLGIVHPTSIPYVSTTNALAERRIRIVKEGTRVSLSTSGVPTSLWPFAAKHFCMSLNIGMLEDTDTPWIGRFGDAFTGRRIPFGQFVKYKPSKSYQLAVHGDRMIDGIFLGWDLAPGCVWHGLYVMCPLREMEITDSDPTKKRNLKINAHVVREGDFEWNTAQNGMSFPCRIARDQLPKLASLPHDNALLEIESEDAELAEKLSSGK